MNIDLEERLMESMRHRVDGITPPADLLGPALRRHQRRTATLRIGYALGLAGAVAAGLALSNPATPGRDTAKAPVVQAAPAGLRLVNAAAASDNISYRLRLKMGGLTYEGAFDPRTDTGYLRQPQDDSVVTELLIDGTRYIGGEPPLGPLPPDKGPGETYGRYGQHPGKHHGLSLYQGSGAALDAATPDPAALFTALKAAGATTSDNPDGTLHFTYATKFELGSSTTAGDVKLDAEGRIALVTLTRTWRSTAKGRTDTGKSTATLELYDYGVKVTVKRPKDVVPTT